MSAATEAAGKGNVPKLKDNRWAKEFEQPLYESWKATAAYAFDAASKKPCFSIDTPPPYVNTPVHIGQVTTYVLMDMFARYKRMRGFNVLFPLGLDKNGLPIEMAAEKEAKIKLTQVTREKALELCKQVLERSSMTSVQSFLKCGISFNSWKIGTGIGEVYETDSPDYRSLTQDTFIDLWNKGLIYEDTRVNNYCPGCQTTLADAEVVYEELPSMFNEIIFKVKETKEDLIIATTRPELVCTCAMVIYHPDDERYKHLQGKTALTPLFNKEVPVMAHPLADMTKGTGLVMMCSAGDLHDIRFFREMSLKPVIAINPDGTMNEHAGFLKGLHVKKARAAIIEKLQQEKLLVKQHQHTHRTPICERSKDPIEFIAMSEYYVKQVEFKEKIKELANKLNFYAPQSRQLMLDWIDSVSIDWPISRRRFYATEVPLWACKKCSHKVLPPKGKYYQPWREQCPVKECPMCKSTEFVGETRVFDTWFDSSISPLYILKWSRNDAFFNKNFPCTLRPQGKEIVRTWLYYTVLKCYLLTGKLIFNDAWINYHIVDEKGYKMSKSKGNVIDPQKALDQYGAEPFRLWAAIEGNLESTDFKCSFERIDGAGKTIMKFWNVAKFISMFECPAKPKKLEPLDHWILSEANDLVAKAKQGFDEYDFHNPSTAIKHFVWETLASHYLELVKNRAYNNEKSFTTEQQHSALWTLHTVLETLLKLWAPVLPFMTAKIYHDMTGKEIHQQAFPEQVTEIKNAIATEELANANSAIWKAKKDAGISLRTPIKKIVLPESLKPIEQDMKLTHGAATIEWGEFRVDL